MRRALPLLLLLAACGTATPGTPAVEEPRHRAAELIGRWHVTGEGIDAGTALLVGDRALVFQPCGVADAAWEADDEQGLLVLSSSSWDGACSEAPAPAPWLGQVAAFASEGDGHRLLDADGGVVAVLAPGATPTVGPNRSQDQDDPPTTPSALLAPPPAPLPQGLRAPAPEDLQGRRWVPVGAEGTQAHAVFGDDGRWSGSDGCNGQGGGYRLGQQGRLVATSGPQTLIGCRGASAGALVDGAARAGLDGEELVLLDGAGAELGRMRPASSSG